MALSDSIIFEVLVQELISYIDCQDFYVKSKFADIFCLYLNNSNDEDLLLPKKQKKKTVIKAKTLMKKESMDADTTTSQSILLAGQLTTLVKAMKHHPIELSLYCKDDPCNKVGSACVPWSPVFIDYLNKLIAKRKATPVYVTGAYNAYDNDNWSVRRVAFIKLKMKLSRLKDNLPSHVFPSITESNQNKTLCTRLNSILPTALSTKKESSVPTHLSNKVVIKTLYTSGKPKKVNPMLNRSKFIYESSKVKTKQQTTAKCSRKPNIPKEFTNVKLRTKPSRLCLVSSNTNLVKKKQIDYFKSKSCSSINRKNVNMLSYIFGDRNRSLGNRVLCVNYFTVKNDFNRNTSSSSSAKQIGNKNSQSSKGSKGSQGTETYISRTESKSRFTFQLCDASCQSKKSDQSEYSLELPHEDTVMVTMSKCNMVRCNERVARQVPPDPDQPIKLDLKNLTKTEEVVGVQAKIKLDKNSCCCTCECTFGFMKRTTYCGVCGGYERAGEDMPTKILTAPFPCPVFHKLNEKKTVSASVSDKSIKGLCDDSQRSSKKSSKSPSGNKSGYADSEKEGKGKSNRKTDDRFKFYYGYRAPQIGHSQCTAPCTGTLGPVPKNMGWLWTADNIPGLKFRPNWRPGATHKHVVHLLKMAKNPGITLGKKKKKDTGKKKKPLKRPLLTVAKKDGEYTVTMETMKIYPRTRALNQQPYEDKPVLTYTVGRTEEENREREKRKEREQRRLERDQRAFIQSAFTDMCKEICLKTYQQALGILPCTEEADCSCYAKHPEVKDVDLDRSCSCSEHSGSFGSDTDSDEWLVEFTPPNATFDPSYKGKKILKTDVTTQYTYLDYRVKLTDRFGNQVPRFFKGPDGKTQCSDLGGFWSTNHKWLEINSDGYIGLDEKWAPMAFTGPNGEHVDCDSGKFQAMNGEWLVVGVDGYVDGNGKWKFYNKNKDANTSKKKRAEKKGSGDKKIGAPLSTMKPSEETFSCFGDVNPKELSKMGILGHGQDKKLLLQKLTEMLELGEDVKIPQPYMVPRLTSKKSKKKRYVDESYYSDRWRCKHPVPSEKGIVAVDGHGNKTYFSLKTPANIRSKGRLARLTHQGISLSSFHLPCFHSFINAEILKKQQFDQRMKMSKNNGSVESKTVLTQYKYDNVVV